MTYTHMTIAIVAALLVAAACAVADDGDPHAFISKIRGDHPRLFFNADTWPTIRERALGERAEHFEKLKAYADGPLPTRDWLPIDNPPPRPGSELAIHDYGQLVMACAFVYRIEPSPELLEKIKDMLLASLDFYEACYEQNREANWYSQSRIGCFAALDWLWDDLGADERKHIGKRLLDHLQVGYTKPGITYRNMGGYRSGYYGVDNCAWFAGVTLLNEDIDDELALEFLKMGFDTYAKLFDHRASAAGDDGGGASATLAYLLGAYPNTEWTFLHSYKAATGDDIAQASPYSYSTLLPNYILWNWLPGDLEFGYGDAAHTTNRLPKGGLYGHMSQLIHFFSESHPDLAAQAAAVRERAGGSLGATGWGFMALLLDDISGPQPMMPQMPPARHFENMGQVFMRSGDGPDDTYALFACGGTLAQHRHFDATHFGIYHRGFLALDTGTREGNTDNLQNYYAQTVAHNCILIKMPDEPPVPYWNGTVYGNAGGQFKAVGSEVIAFETTDLFTYVAGDATAVYRPEKCSQLVRQFVFIPPAHFIVFDRVISTDATYPKRWLLHHANEPVLMGDTWHSDQDRGRIFCRTLLPADAVIEPVGGPGKEFLADGVNYAIDAGPSQERIDRNYPSGQRQYEEVPELMGRWRIEVSPGAARTDDIFLHLIEVGDQTLGRMVDATLEQTDDAVAVTFTHGAGTVTLRLNTTGDIGGSIRIETPEGTVVDRPLTNDVMPQQGIASMH